MKIIYRGTRTRKGCVITANGRPIDPRFDLVKHSPDGFEWGYDGSGPAQTALALLAHVVGRERALASYQDFKRHVVIGLGADWYLTDEEIQAAVKTIELGRAYA